MVGQLLFIHTTGTVINKISKYILRLLIDQRIRTATSSCRRHNNNNNDRRNRLCIPIHGIAASRMNNNNALQYSSRSNSNSNSNSNSSGGGICAICRTPERKYPACSVRCGHVFCWYCIYQWVSQTIPECPICRQQCHPNDILPLYNYTPT